MYKDIEMLKMAFHFGAKGYLVKENTSEELVACIQTVLNGGQYLSKIVRDQASSLFPTKEVNYKITQEIQSLSQTEWKTLKLVSQNYSSKEIAELLFISVKSVDNNRSRICKKPNYMTKN
jgi:two-component system response regulator NreC